MKVTTREQWLAARKSLLVKEKELTHAQAALVKERRQLPIYLVTEDYRFTAPDGSTTTLADLFAGRRQLIVYHFMFAPANDAGYNACSFLADNMPSHLGHLWSQDTTLVFISRAPIEKIEGFKKRMGWNIP